MPTSRHWHQIRRCALGGLAALAMAFALPAGSAVAQDDQEFMLQFHSFVPARESFKRPKQPKVANWQSDMDKAGRAWQKGKYVTARRHLEKARGKGHVIAAWYLGHIYQQGRGVKKNDAVAFKYFREVARTRNDDLSYGRRMIVVDARVRVADFYREGSKTAKVKRDPRRAFKLYNGATSHGHPGAEFGLGVIYLRGLGVKKNPRRALRWLSIASRNRYAPAEALLGDLYWEGMYVAKDSARALTWYCLARQTANPVAHRHIFERLDEMLVSSSEADRTKAKQWCSRLNKKYPVRAGVLPVSD